MRKHFRSLVAMALLLSTVSITGCAGMGQYSSLGAIGGGFAGSAVTALVKNQTNFTKVAPLIGTAVGAAIGYVVDYNVNKQAEAEKSAQQQLQLNVEARRDQERQFEQVKNNTRLSSRVFVLTDANGNGYWAENGAKLAEATFNVQDGGHLKMYVGTRDLSRVAQDMRSNGFEAVSTQKVKGNANARLVTYRKFSTPAIVNSATALKQFR